MDTSMEDLHTHPDYAYYGLLEQEKTIGVRRIEEIINHSYFTAAVNMKVIVLDHMDKVTLDAQNKLLKTIEEANVVILGLAYSDSVIPTLRSRMQIIRVCNEEHIIPESVRIIMDEVKDYLSVSINSDFHDLFRILGLVKEKDPKSFFMLYREFIPELLDLIGKLVVDKQIYQVDKDYCGLLALLCRDREVCGTSSYSKDDFFELIVQVIENL